MSETPTYGTFGWFDLTVDDAETVRDFYADVVGWTPEPVDMGGYSDYNMCAGDGTATAGVCHARGSNADLPAQWLVYVHIPDLDASLEKVAARGGECLSGPKGSAEAGRYAIVRDPAGAVMALFEPPAPA